jgi:hypothetical protein
MIIAIWVVAAVLVAMWSLAAFSLQRLLAGDGAWVADIGPRLGRVPFGDVLERWFPTWQQSALQALETLQSALQWLGGAAPVLVWSLWTLGTLAIVLLAAALTLIVALVRRNMPPRQPAGPGGAPQA